MQLPEVGEIFESRYQVVDVIGRGGFASVYRAVDTTMQRDVAIKVLTPVEGVYEETTTARFLREARVLADLRDPHTITMYDFGATDEGLRYMVFEFVRGEELGALIRRLGRLEPRVVVHMLKQLLSALREAHGHGVLHRDIKPANILVFEYAGDPFRVKLLDFGIAKDSGAVDHAITQEGRVVGTPRYMSPEQLFGQQVTPASDLYTLGLVAFEMLVGKPAVEGDSNKELMVRQVSDEPFVVPPMLGPEVLRQIIEKLTAREPADRYQSAADVLADLKRGSSDIAAWVAPILLGDDDLLDTEPNEVVPPLARPPMPSGNLAAPPTPPPERSPSPVALVVGVAAIVASVGVGVFSLMRENAPPPADPSVRRDVMLALAGAPGAAPEPATKTLEAADAAAEPVKAPPDGCGQDAPFLGQGRFGRRIEVFIPPTYDANVRHPVLLMFHRSLADGASILADTRFSEIAREHGFLIFAFNSDNQYPWREQRELDRVLADLDTGFARLCIDRSRVWVLGEGNGGGFGERLACEFPVSALAVTGYGEHMGQEVCVPKTPTPKLRLYGNRDRHVPANGGASCVPMMDTHMSATDIEERWKGHYACSGAGTRWGTFKGGACRTWKCETAPFVVCEANDGHYWPTAAPPGFELEPCKTPPPRTPFDYRGAVWKFFAEEGRVLGADEVRPAQGSKAP